VDGLLLIQMLCGQQDGELGLFKTRANSTFLEVFLSDARVKLYCVVQESPSILVKARRMVYIDSIIPPSTCP